jgi:hypothetical protein
MKYKHYSGFLNCLGLTLLLTVLKIFEEITLNWFFVFIPIWAPLLVAGVLSLIFILINKYK